MKELFVLKVEIKEMKFINRYYGVRKVLLCCMWDLILWYVGFLFTYIFWNE